MEIFLLYTIIQSLKRSVPDLPTWFHLNYFCSPFKKWNNKKTFSLNLITNILLGLYIVQCTLTIPRNWVSSIFEGLFLRLTKWHYLESPSPLNKLMGLIHRTLRRNKQEQQVGKTHLFTQWELKKTALEILNYIGNKLLLCLVLYLPNNHYRG